MVTDIYNYIIFINKGIKMQRKFGIEIEVVNLDRNTLTRKLREQNVECHFEGYTHRVTSHWKIVTDSSVSGGYELVSPVLFGEEGLSTVKKVLNCLNESKRNTDMDLINYQCGLHVHIEAKDLSTHDVHQIATRYRDNESIIDAWMPQSRRGNSRWAQSIQSSWSSRYLEAVQDLQETYTNVGNALRNCQNTRYSKINFTRAYANYKTIEFRHHSGTTDFNKISNWIEFLQNFVEQSTKCKNTQSRISCSYNARKKSAMFAEIREQVSALGGKLFFQGSWKIVNENGRTINLKSSGSNGYEFLSNLYVEGTRQLDSVRFNAFMKKHFKNTLGNENAEDKSVMAGQPHHVREFFTMRTSQLRRTA